MGGQPEEAAAGVDNDDPDLPALVSEREECGLPELPPPPAEPARSPEADYFAGIALDLVKFFDMVPFEQVFDLFEHLGLPLPLARALRGFYREVECRFAIGTTLGAVFRKTSGVFQGVPVWLCAARIC